MSVSCFDGRHGLQSESSFPLGYYEGVCIDVDCAAAARWMRENVAPLSTDFAALRANLLGGHWYMAEGAGPRCEHVFRELFENLLKELHVHYTVGKTWSTDAFYRETPQKTAQRKAEGCIAVEMECAALTACAAFRQVSFSQFLYAADSLDGEAWDARGLHHKGLHIRDQLLNIALEAALELHKQLP